MKSYVDLIKRREEACMHLRSKTRFHSSWTLMKAGKNQLQARRFRTKLLTSPMFWSETERLASNTASVRCALMLTRPEKSALSTNVQHANKRTQVAQGKNAPLPVQLVQKPENVRQQPAATNASTVAALTSRIFAQKPRNQKLRNPFVMGVGRKSVNVSKETTEPPSRAQRSFSECMRTTNNRTLMTLNQRSTAWEFDQMN